MGNWLTIAIVILNIFSIIMSLKMIKGFEKGKCLIYVLITEIIVFVISYIVYALTAGGVLPEVHQNSKWMLVLTMLPINVMIIACPILSQINKMAFNEIKDSDFKKRVIVLLAISVIIVFVEVMYVKDIQIGIQKFIN